MVSGLGFSWGAKACPVRNWRFRKNCYAALIVLRFCSKYSAASICESNIKAKIVCCAHFSPVQHPPWSIRERGSCDLFPLLPLLLTACGLRAISHLSPTSKGTINPPRFKRCYQRRQRPHVGSTAGTEPLIPRRVTIFVLSFSQPDSLGHHGRSYHPPLAADPALRAASILSAIRWSLAAISRFSLWSAKYDRGR